MSGMKVFVPKLLKNGFRIHRSFTTNCETQPLINKLLNQPLSSMKSILDSDNNNDFTFKSPQFSWNNVVTALKSSPHKANSVIEWRLEKLIERDEINHDCYCELMSLCAKIQNSELALRVFTSMEALGFKSTTCSFNVLASTYFSSGDVLTALSLFEIMARSEDYNPNSDTYNVYISAYANLGKNMEMQAWYSAKLAAGFSADLQTYEFLVSGCVNSRDFGDAERFYEEMMVAGFRPTVSILQNMLLVYCGLRKFGKVKELLKFILDSRLEINGLVAEKVIRLYSEYGGVDEMEKLLPILSSHDDQGSEIHRLVHSTIISLYSKADRLDDLEYIVGSMLKKGISFRSSSDVEKIICSYFRREAYDRLDLFLERIKGSVEFTKSTYDLLVSGYRRAALPVKLNEVINDMKQAGF